MKKTAHALAGVIGLICILAFSISSLLALTFGPDGMLATVKFTIFKSVALLVLALLVAGGSGVSLMGKRKDAIIDVKQKRGPIAFMTSFLVLVPCAFLLARWAGAGTFGPWFYGVQTVELLASALVLAMILLNMRDGMALTGRIAPRRAGKTAKDPTIDQRADGPLVVLGVASLEGENGEALVAKPVMALCRCGASKTKPFCDGSHTSIGFDSSTSDDRTKDEILTYKGEDFTVHYNRLLCSHAAECGKRLKPVFDSNRKPWIMPENGSAKDIQAVVRACPSGAMRFSETGQEPALSDDGSFGIKIEENGPYRVSGVALSEPNLAQGAHPQKYVLCRCGASKNKPYCDGSHFDIDWKSAES